MVSPGSSGFSALVCSDCGLPMDGQLRSEKPLWRWQEAITLVLVGGLAVLALGLMWISDAVTEHQQELDAPAPTQHGGSHGEAQE